MSSVFLGGSRHVSRLPAQAKERLDNVIENGLSVLVGDANGADKAIQKYLIDAHYKNVTVFCSGPNLRNNLGHWTARRVETPKHVRGFQFYAVKDREMAREADFGLMIWDGKSTGTLLNVLRLVRAGKKAVLVNVPEKKAITFKGAADWSQFIARCNAELQNDIRERATPEEWMPSDMSEQASMFGASEAVQGSRQTPSSQGASDAKLMAQINEALAAGDPTSVVDVLGNIARSRGMGQIAKDSGLARESLYRSLSANGNPEFATVLRVMASVGLRLKVSNA